MPASSRPTVTPMLATMVDELPSGPGWLYEPKVDGFRCIANIDTDGRPTLRSRRGTNLNDAFPEIVAAVARQLPADSIVDGEIVRWGSTGRLDFEALQRRNRSNKGARELARSEPCHFIVFDLLRDHGTDLLGSPLADRRRILEELLSGQSPTNVILGMQTNDLAVARQWSEQLAAVGIEGIVAKRANQPYQPGSRSWSKIKHYATTEAVIGGVTGSLERPQALVLGRIHRSDGQLHIVGRTTELKPAAAEQVAAAVTPAADDHPWPERLPPSWHDRTERDYHRVQPEVVAEIRVDVATANGDDQPNHWRHQLRFLRLRTDLATSDIPTNLDLER